MLPSTDPGPQSQKAFTLIQLMVVIGIIAVLAAVSISTLTRARHLALLTSCANNMRQIAQAGNLYRSNSGGLWPPLQYSSGFSDFTLFAPYTSNYDIFRCPASGTEFINSVEQLVEVTDYVYMSDMSAQFTDNDFNRGHGNTAGFDPGNPVANRILSYLFNRNQIDDYIIFDASADHHDGTVNVCWLRDGRVEQRDPITEGLPEMVAFQQLYEDGANLNSILDDLNIPPGTVVDCLYCGGTGQVMNPNSGKLQNDAACGGDGTITY